MRWSLRLDEYRLKTEYRKAIKNCQGDAMSRLASESHMNVQIDEEIHVYDRDCKLEVDLVTDWRDDEVFPLYFVFAASEQHTPTSEPLLIKEFFESNLATNSLRTMPGDAPSVHENVFDYADALLNINCSLKRSA
eukprot:IDg16339t1